MSGYQTIKCHVSINFIQNYYVLRVCSEFTYIHAVILTEMLET